MSRSRPGLVALVFCQLVTACAGRGPTLAAVPPPSPPAPVSTPAAARSPASSVLGFSPERAAAQQQRETQLDAAIDPKDLRAWMEAFTALPHHVGSAHGKKNAEAIAAMLAEWGFVAEIRRYDVLFPVPMVRKVELVAPTRFRARLDEPTLREDKVSAKKREQLPGYHAYAADGDVTAELVYVNYGLREDYERLEQLKVDVRGKIVIARYGQSWRGIKPRMAAERGAVGCIVYSDPRDDGYYHGDAYPQGAFRHPHSVQRGSVYDLPRRTGDPQTPFAPSLPGAKRLPLSESETLAKIPVLPIGYADAEPLLRALGGPVAPESFRGALPLTYHVGPGPAKVHLELKHDWTVAPAYDVIAKLPGTDLADQWIIRGNHHDAWVAGADDPVSGLVALLAEAKAIGTLAKTGWRPRRTIVYAAWDAEEPGIIGSTEWVEEHADLLSRVAAVYVNSDSNGRGFLRMGGSHALSTLVNQAAASVADPQLGMPVRERLRASMLLGSRPKDKEVAQRGGDLPLFALGSGSDYTPFLQHLGISALDLRFGGEDEGGSYHSVYDSFDHYVRFVDPGFAYGAALAKVAGRVVLRLADADLLPFRFEGLTAALEGYATEVEELANKLRTEAEEREKFLRDGVYVAAADPTKPFAPPRPRKPVPFLELAPLKNAVARLKIAAQRFDAAATRAPGSASAEARGRADAAIMQVERALAPRAGLPGRPWYRHLVYAPGLFTGYGVKTLPVIREALENEDYAGAAEGVRTTAAAIEAAAAAIESATTALGTMTG